MENKTVGYTPGPWRVCFQSPSVVETGYREGAGVSIVRIEPLPKALGEYGNLDEQRFSNARLIAAAPELLAGAKELEHYASRLPFESATVGLIDSLVRIRAAIAKAEGR